MNIILLKAWFTRATRIALVPRRIPLVAYWVEAVRLHNHMPRCLLSQLAFR